MRDLDFIDDLGRREAIKLLAACSLGSLLPLSAAADPKNRMHVVIIGGGIGGASTAKYLRLLNSHVKITIIEPNKEYIFCPGSNELLPGWQSVKDLTVTYTTLKTRYRVDVIEDRAEHVDYSKKEVSLAKGGSVAYDKLVVSPGPTYDYSAIEGYSTELANTRFPSAWHVSRQSIILRDQIRALPRGGTVLISVPKAPYRCPPAPYERATFIAGMLKESDPTAKVMVLDAKDDFVFKDVYSYYWKKNFGYGTKAASIEWVSGSDGGHISKLDAGESSLVNREGERFKGDVLNIIPPHKAAKFALENDIATGDWCSVEYQDYTSTRHKDLYVIGDTIESDPMPKTGYVASNQARVVAQAINDQIHGRPVGTPFIVNDCIAMVEKGLGMTLSEVFRYNGRGKPLVEKYYVPAVDKNPQQELMLEALAQVWQRNFRRSVFG